MSNDRGIQGGGTPRGSRALARVIRAIAAASGFDLTKVGGYRRIDNPPWMSLSIEVTAQNRVSIAHYGEDDETGKPMADPAVTYFITAGDGAFVPLESANDYVGEYMVAATVENGQVVVTDPGTLRTLIKFSNSWAEQLRLQRYRKAATQSADGEG